MCWIEPSPRKPKQKAENIGSDISLNKRHFQVNVQMATPACKESCPNLQIDIEDLKYTADNIDDLYRLRQIRCVNAEYCQNLYKAFDKKREADA